MSIFLFLLCITLIFSVYFASKAGDLNIHGILGRMPLLVSWALTGTAGLVLLFAVKTADMALTYELGTILRTLYVLEAKIEGRL